jgi:hypothetical protein
MEINDRAALRLCQKMNWRGVLVRGGLKTGNVYVFDGAEQRLQVQTELEKAS